MIRTAAALALWTALAGPAAAQSMNVRAIAEGVAGEVCAPFARTGDMAAAIAAAGSLGYRVRQVSPDNEARATDPDAPPAMAWLEKPHGGRLVLSKQWARGLCAIAIDEGGVGQIDEAAAPVFEAMGMHRVLTEPEGPTAIVVWRGAGVQALIAASPHAVPGSELTVSFDTGWRPGAR